MTAVDRAVGLPVAETVDAAGEQAPKRPGATGNIVSPVLVGAALLVASAAFLYPFLWLIGASMRPRAFTFVTSPLPIPFAPSNYVTIWDQVPLLLWITNSVTVGVTAALAVTVSSAFVAWGFAYFRFRGRGVLFCAGAGHDDAAGRGDDGSGLPHLGAQSGSRAPRSRCGQATSSGRRSTSS